MFALDGPALVEKFEFSERLASSRLLQFSFWWPISPQKSQIGLHFSALNLGHSN